MKQNTGTRPSECRCMEKLCGFGGVKKEGYLAVVVVVSSTCEM